MSRSFSFLSLSNALCLISFWSLVALEIVVAKMNLKNENDDTAISLTTISTSFIWVGFVLDNAVCFTEFLVVGIEVQAPPVSFYWLSAGRYVTYMLSIMTWYDLISVKITLEIMIFWTFGHIASTILAIAMCFVNKNLSNEVDGINNPVVYAVGPTGNKAMAGA
jgi:hypothetical protein